jgi:glutathione synthase
MRIAFLVNDRRDLGAQQTTTLLIGAALGRGHEVVVCGVGDLTLTDEGELLAAGCEATQTDPGALILELADRQSTSHPLDARDLCVVRTNPGRDESHRAEHVAALRLLERLEERGVAVVNSARGLSRALTKLSLLDLPSRLRPRTLVTRDASAIERFVEDAPSRAVIKPLEGTRGRDVFVLEPARSSANVKQIIDVVLRQGYAVVQEFVPGAEKGDVRVTVVDGEILEIEGQAAAIARVPSRDDFRSNLHAGGSAARASITPQMRDAIEAISPLLQREGLRHVGVDFVGGRILELNVFSPGGLFPSERLYQHDFSSAVIEAFERRV